MADALSALAHPIRLKIIFLLLEKEACVCELAGNLNLPQSLVSQHLAILRGSGLVKTQRVGNRISYSIADERLKNLLEISYLIISQRLKEISTLIGGE
ncbi:winged helix-turn-helix transcriptional regulator [bacterium]|nr:winged helix-turn-helix transcriptional regulator [bacterium]